VNEHPGTEQTPAEQPATRPDSVPDSTQQPPVLVDAWNATRSRHPDFDLLEPIMDRLARALTPDWTKIAPEEYLETLYVVARHAYFTDEARRVAFAHAQPNQPKGVM
jgi:hypothetical protein